MEGTTRWLDRAHLVQLDRAWGGIDALAPNKIELHLPVLFISPSGT